MIKRNKIILTFVIILVCSGLTLIFLQKEGRGTVSKTDIPDTDLTSKRQLITSDKELVSELDTESLYHNLSNHPRKGEEQLLFYKDSLIALSREVQDSIIHLDSSQQEKAELQYEILLLKD